MAKINNTSAYPNVIPTADDFVILTDVTDDDKTKTSKEILSCNTNPVTIIPGIVGHYIVPISILFQYNHVSASYAGVNDFYIDLGGNLPSTRWCVAPGIIGVGNTQAYVNGEDVAGLISNSPKIGLNSDILFTNGTANPTAGDGTLDIQILYRIVSA